MITHCPLCNRRIYANAVTHSHVTYSDCMRAIERELRELLQASLKVTMAMETKIESQARRIGELEGSLQRMNENVL